MLYSDRILTFQEKGNKQIQESVHRKCLKQRRHLRAVHKYYESTSQAYCLSQVVMKIVHKAKSMLLINLSFSLCIAKRMIRQTSSTSEKKDSDFTFAQFH